MNQDSDNYVIASIGVDKIAPSSLCPILYYNRTVNHQNLISNKPNNITMSTTPTANTLLPPAVRVAKILGTVGAAYAAGNPTSQSPSTFPLADIRRRNAPDVSPHSPLPPRNLRP